MCFIPYPHSCTSLYTLVDSHQEVATREDRRMDAHAGRRSHQGATRPDLHGEGTICLSSNRILYVCSLHCTSCIVLFIGIVLFDRPTGNIALAHPVAMSRHRVLHNHIHDVYDRSRRRRKRRGPDQVVQARRKTAIPIRCRRHQ